MNPASLLPSVIEVRPMVMLTGFLGAGKTTFLRSLLDELSAREHRADAILNDRENAQIDSETLVVKRITTIIAEHRDASRSLDVEIGAPELHLVIDGLRNHAQGGKGTLDLAEVDEIKAHCLNRLFEELVEEPSNIPYTTQTSPDSVRYDAMETDFWLECLDLLKKLNPCH